MGRYAAAARRAAELTNKELATEIAVVAPASREELTELLPTKSDKVRFLELMKIVEAETAEDEKLARLMANVESLGAVALKALRIFV